MIGTTLRRIRHANGMTQSELAAPRYTHAYVSSIESGRRRPSRPALEHFASKLGVDVEELEVGRRPGAAARLELQLQEALVSLSAGELTDADASFQALAKRARKEKLPHMHAKAEEGWGLLLERQGLPEVALEHYVRAEEILGNDPPTSRADAVAGKARCFHSLGDTRYEIHILETLLGEIERERLNDPNALARLHAALVYAYVEAGLYRKAAESATELERLAPKITDSLRIAQMHLNVARVYLVQNQVDEATRSLQRAEDCYRQLNLKTETGYAHLALGYVFSRDGRLEQARHELEQALGIFEEAADAKDLPRVLNELARLERLGGRWDRAQALLGRSISLMGEADTPILAWAHRELGLVFASLNPSQAEKNFRAAIEMYERSEQSVEVAVTYRSLGDLLDARGDHEGGCEAFRTGIAALEPGS
jgi:tetratricopeptide (TPR) repeat protein